MARKILLADDSVTAQNMGRRILSDAGYDVTTVNNGSAALKRIAESKPDLIVLDVYMPGYGGLEVCQRLREAPETARIPVLLTVGKLEPFKADEARRVRADAFIVKPFEASELLTALTKLEDKIVPQAQPAKPGRFAKALAAADEFATSKEFGDSETGWKNRLSIPPPHAKPRESEPEERPAAASVHDAARTEERPPAEMKSGLEEALLSALPQDVTPEEIAAIKAAAMAFNAPSDASSLRMHPVDDQREASTHESDAKTEELPQESVVSAENRGAAATFASASEDRGPENIPAVAQAELAAPAEQFMAAERVASADSSGEVAATPAVSESPAPAAPVENRNLADEEVSAALASLAPTKGNGDAAALDGETAKWGFAARDRFSASMAAAIGAQEFNGARWVAEPVSLGEDEATLILEQEMERAYASFAAADAARTSFASSPVEPYPALPVAEFPTANPETASFPMESFSNSDQDESRPAEPTVQTAAEAEVPAMAASPTEAVSENTVDEVKELSAYAAAASASTGTTESTMATEAVSQPNPGVESSDSIPPPPETGERHGESDVAAAWANWRHIRESGVVSQPSVSQPGGFEVSSQIAETVAEIQQSSVEAEPDSQADAPAEDSSEISNLVDSVLADLKPKLMAEIAKKMGKDKKK